MDRCTVIHINNIIPYLAYSLIFVGLAHIHPNNVHDPPHTDAYKEFLNYYVIHSGDNI